MPQWQRDRIADQLSDKIYKEVGESDLYERMTTTGLNGFTPKGAKGDGVWDTVEEGGEYYAEGNGGGDGGGDGGDDGGADQRNGSQRVMRRASSVEEVPRPPPAPRDSYTKSHRGIGIGFVSADGKEDGKEKEYEVDELVRVIKVDDAEPGASCKVGNKPSFAPSNPQTRARLRPRTLAPPHSRTLDSIDLAFALLHPRIPRTVGDRS